MIRVWLCLIFLKKRLSFACMLLVKEIRYIQKLENLILLLLGGIGKEIHGVSCLFILNS